jgi:hypothetical protein
MQDLNDRAALVKVVLLSISSRFPAWADPSLLNSHAQSYVVGTYKFLLKRVGSMYEA